MDVSLPALALLVVASFVAGTVDAIAGGGGLITLPALLAAGLPPALALGTNKGQSVFGSGAALLRYARAGLVDGRVARVTFPAGLAGVARRRGAGAARAAGPAAPGGAGAARGGGGGAGLPPRRAAPRPRPSAHRSLAVAAAIALVIGAYDGFFGPGTGTFLIFGFVIFFGAGMREASADAKVVNFASNLAAVALFASRGLVAWNVALPMAAGQFAGGLAGAHLAVRGGDRLVRWVVLLVVLVLVVKLGADLARG